MNKLRQEALIADLQKLYDEIPDFIQAVKNGDEKMTAEALAIITGASGKRINLLMGRLTDYVLDEAKKGNKRPLQMIASGEAFE